MPYIIHYALAHQAAQAVLRWSHSKRALIISLPLGGQLLEQKTQKLQSIPACSDCSKREGERESDGGLLLAWRTVDSSSRVVVWLFWHRMSRTKVNGVSISSVSFQLIQTLMVSRSFLMHDFIARGKSLHPSHVQTERRTL